MVFECNNSIYTQTPNGKTVGIHIIPREEFEKMIPHVPKFLRRFYRGLYLSSGNIYIREGVRRGFQKLVDHEMGHADGLGHTWKPTTMNPIWLLRWFK